MRFLNAGFIIVFMTMLILPLIFVDVSSGRVSETENRMLAERPKLEEIKVSPEIFVREFDAWFKDSTGFREQMIAFYNLVDKNKLLNNEIRYTDGPYVYLVGEEGHHYFADTGGWLMRKFQGQPLFPDRQLRQFVAKIEEVKTYLDKKDIPLVVMFCTDKESIYPEYYPKSIKRGPEPNQLDVVTNYLKENTSADVFNIREALLAEKDKYLLYFLRDTRSFSDAFAHYNEIGAFFAYRELMKYIGTHFPRMVPFELSDMEITYDEKEIPHVAFKGGAAYKRLDQSFFDAFSAGWPFNWGNEVFENTEADGPVILFLGDSYSAEQYTGKYLARHFGKSIFIHFGNIANFEEYIAGFNPDIVVLESSERQLKSFFAYISGIPELP